MLMLIILPQFCHSFICSHSLLPLGKPFCNTFLPCFPCFIFEHILKIDSLMDFHFNNNNIDSHFNIMTFKQEYLHRNGPYPFNFNQERHEVFLKIKELLNSFHPNEWAVRGFLPLSFIESFKQVYGFTSTELVELISIMFKRLKEHKLSCEGNIAVLKVLVNLRSYRINLQSNLRVDNIYFIDLLQKICQEGIKFPIKNADLYLDTLFEVIRDYSKFGEETIERPKALAIQNRDIRYIALFSRSIKSQETAKNLISFLFEESSVLERSIPFYSIVAELLVEFPNISLAQYRDTLSHEIIKCITTVVDPQESEQTIKKLVEADPGIGVPSILKSIAKILIFTIKPVSQPGWEVSWSLIERIFSIIKGIIDHSHQVQSMGDFLIFMEQFVRCFLARYRKERGLFQQVNEDYVEQFQSEPAKFFVLGQEYLKLLNQIFVPLIPELLYIEDSENLSSKILFDLSVFDPKTYLGLVLAEIKAYLQKDITIHSLTTSKISLLTLQEFVCKNYFDEQEFTLLIQCCQGFLSALDKLGVTENLDILELVIRVYICIPENGIDQKPMMGNLTQDIISIMEQNLDAMSINLEATEGEEAELYFDFRNIYFNFIIRLSKQQIKSLCDKMIYKIVSSVPAHRLAYEFIVICLTYVQPNFGNQVLNSLYKYIVVENQDTATDAAKQSPSSIVANEVFPYYSNFSLATHNEQNLKWYSSIIQCAFQYNPENIVKNWTKIEAFVMLMLKQFEKSNIFDWGLDIIFNLAINLSSVHLPPNQFYKDTNRNYKTISNIQWKQPSAACIQVLSQIKDKFYDSITTYMQKKYGEVLKSSTKAANIRSSQKIQVALDSQASNNEPIKVQIRQKSNQILDSLFTSEVPSAEDLEQKKYFNKLISIQYSIFSALQMKSQFCPGENFKEIEPYFLKELGCMRESGVAHLKWLIELYVHYNCLNDPNLLKTLHYFWREAHDELYFSTGIESTNQKLNPFYETSSYRKKEIFQSSFFIVTECYVLFMMRVELFCMIKPMAYLNNPEFLEYVSPFSFSSLIDTSLKSFVPIDINIHAEQHTYTLNLYRSKISLANQDSFISKFVSLSNESQKQKQLSAIRELINSFKRSLNLLNYPCCLKSQSSWFGLLEILELTKYVDKKIDKIIIIDSIYLLVLFNFDFKASTIFTSNLKRVQKGEEQFSQEDLNIIKKVQNFVQILIQKIKSQMNKKFLQKNMTTFVLLLISFSELLPLDNQLFLEIFPLAISITLKGKQDLMNIGKTLIFRILNRYIKSKQNNQVEPNTPVKRDYDTFLYLRHIGGKTEGPDAQPPSNLITDKVENYYYPSTNLHYLNRLPLNPNSPNENLIIESITNAQTLKSLFKALITDSDLKSGDENMDYSDIHEGQAKNIHSNGHKLLSFIIDSNPLRVDSFLSFIDNFSNYPICFYHRLFRKLMILGGPKTVNICQQIVREHLNSLEKQEIKLAQFIMAETLAFDPSQEYTDFCANYLVTCTKQNYTDINGALGIVFCIDWRIAKGIFNKIIGRMREEKGPSRLRHFELFNTYILCVGRFGVLEARDGISFLLKGIDEGADEVSELIVSILVYCFIYPINLNILKDWVKQTSLQLAVKQNLYKLDKNTGYAIDKSVSLILNEIMSKSSLEENMQSKNLKIYSNIATKILGSISIKRFNNEFYKLFKEMMAFMVNRPLEQGDDELIISQMKASEYPQNIYDELITQLSNLKGSTPSSMRKKLRYLQGIVINKSFVSDRVNIPDVFSALPEKQIGIEHIVAISNIARIMKEGELTAEVQKILSSKTNQPQSLNYMMVYLLAAGNRQFEWRQQLLNKIIGFKKHKIVKEFVSYWWRGRTPESEQEQRLYTLVRIVENPYSYFA